MLTKSEFSIPANAYADERAEKWAVILLIVGTLIRILFFFFATNNGGDALARASVTAGWLQHPTWSLDFMGPHWLPFHFWLMAFVSLVVGNVALGCRLLSLMFGVASLWFFWRLARDQYGDCPAVLSLLVFVFYSMHIGYSTTSSSEATYLGLLLAGLLAFVTYRRTHNLGTLALSAACLAIGAGVRYEVWIFIFALTLLLVVVRGGDKLFSRRRARATLLFAVIAGSWPVFWMMHQWRVYGDPLFSVTHNAESVPRSLAIAPDRAGIYQILLSPGVILITLTPLAVLGAIYALGLAVKEPRGRELAIVAAIFLAIQFRGLIMGRLLATARYTLTDGVLLALLAGYGIYRLAEKFQLLSYGTVVTATAAIVICNLAAITYFSAHQNRFADKFRSVSPLLQYPVQIQDIGQFLRPRLVPRDELVIDTYNDDSNIVAAALGLPLLGHAGSFLASETDPELVSGYIQTQRPKYLVLSSQGVVRAFIPVPEGCQRLAQVHGLDLSCVYHNGVYQVYSVSYPQFASNQEPPAH